MHEVSKKANKRINKVRMYVRHGAGEVKKCTATNEINFNKDRKTQDKESKVELKEIYMTCSQ